MLQISKLEDSQRNLLKYLLFLALTFIVGIVSVLVIFFFLISQNSHLKERIQEQNSKFCIGRYIVAELYQAESKFFRISMTDVKKGRELLRDELFEHLDNIKHALTILQNGGELKQKLKLNIIGESQSYATIIVKKPIANEYKLELVEISPKLAQLKESVNGAMGLYDQRDIYLTQKDGAKITEIRQKVTNFLKTEPAVITRITENANRLLHESLKELRALEAELDRKRNVYTNMMLITAISISIVSGLFFVLIALKIFSINKKLEEKIKEETRKNREADLVIFEQKRRASVFELLINIAHQWRQPLNVVALSIQQINEMVKDNDYDEETINRLSRTSTTQIQKISSVISAFTSFYEKQNQLMEFSVKNSIDIALSFLADTLKESNISVDNCCQNEYIIYGPKTELVEIYMSLLQNSIDIKNQRNLESAKLSIGCSERSGFVNITICDDCGGIDKSIIDSIFDPYTTTAFKSHNKGLGLFNVKNIIEYKFSGHIAAKNIEGGACFEITIPIRVEPK